MSADFQLALMIAGILPATPYNKLMKILIACAFVLFTSLTFAAAPNTMRVDYYHTGNSTSEIFSVDRVLIEPLPWPGNLNKSIDDTNLGKYFFEVIDSQSNKVLYSRGFASVYGEWESTDEATKVHKTFHESFRFPEPATPVQIHLKKRNPKNEFVE